MTSTSGKSTVKAPRKSTGKSTGKATFKKFAKLALMTCALALGCNTHTFAEGEREITTLNAQQITNIGLKVVANFTLPQHLMTVRALSKILLGSIDLEDYKTVADFLFTSINIFLKDENVKPLTDKAKTDIENSIKNSVQEMTPKIQDALQKSIGATNVNSLQELIGLMQGFELKDVSAKSQTIEKLQNILNGLQIPENPTFAHTDFSLKIIAESLNIKLEIPDILKELKLENQINQLKEELEKTKKGINQYLEDTKKGVDQQVDNIKNSNPGEHFLKPFVEMANIFGIK